MIKDISFNTEMISPGESRPLIVWTDNEPVYVEIQCFREPPQPAKLQRCKECGSFTVVSGQEILLTASRSVFEDTTGFLLISIVDNSGDQREFHLNVRMIGGTKSYA